eukprot:8901299-Pyramimonas_sp.AAC.2
MILARRKRDARRGGVARSATKCGTSVTTVWHECDDSVARVCRQCGTSVTTVGRECDESVTRVTTVGHEGGGVGDGGTKAG